MLQTGLNLTASDVSKLLEQNDKTQDGVRTWRRLFGNASLDAAAQTDNLVSEYSDAIAEAYKANLERENQILGSGLSSGTTKSMLALNRKELSDTYNNFVNNYAKGMSDIAAQNADVVGSIYEGLSERGKNFADLYNSAYSYINDELFGASYMTDGNPIYEKDGKDTKFTGEYEQVMHDYITEHKLDWLVNPETQMLYDWESIAPMLFDEQGDINDKGRDFFNQVFNAIPEGYKTIDDDGNERDVRSFDKWLSDTNPELRDWYASADEFNYTFAGTNKGTAQTLVGMDSNAQASGTSAQGMVNAINNTIDDLSKADFNANDAKSKLESYNNVDSEKMLDANLFSMIDTRRKKKKRSGEAEEAWNTYVSKASSQMNNLLNLTKQLPSSDEFMKTYSGIVNKVSEILSKADAAKYYDENIVNEINKAYKDLYAALKKYGDENTLQDNRNKSGF